MSEQAEQRDLATSRFLWLIDALADEHQRAWGWQRHVARQLCVSPSYISKVRAGHVRWVTLGTVNKACASLGLSRAALLNQDADLSQGWRAFRDESEAESTTSEVDLIAAISETDAATWRRVRAWADSYFGASA